MNEFVIIDENEELHQEMDVQDKSKQADKKTTPYPISSYITFSKATNQYRTSLTAS